MPACSVVIKCLNEAGTIREALESLGRQTGAVDWEVVLADNGSTDGTKEIFLEWARRHPQITARLVDASAERGRAHALNAGIRAASGEYLLFLDADDTIEPGYVATMAAALQTHEFVAARLDTRRLNDPWVSDMRPGLQDHELERIPFEPYCLHAGGGTLGFRRHVYEATGGFDPALGSLEDGDFCIRAHLAGFRLVFVPDAIYNYRFRSSPDSVYRQSFEYSRARALLRCRYGAPTARLAPKPWLALGQRIAKLWLGRAKRVVTRRPGTREQEARFARSYGKAMGELSGAIAYGVAPAIATRRDDDSPKARPVRSPSQSSGPLNPRPSLLGAFRTPARRLKSMLGGSIAAVRTDERVAALTFDDGPDPASTPILLDVLARSGVKATFFVVGQQAVRHPDLIERIVAEGHEIGNHTWDHPSLPQLRPSGVAGQIRRTRDALAPHGQRLMRPPYGDQTALSTGIARALGYLVVRWSLSGGDWHGEDAETLADRIVANMKPGAIVLLHDSLFTYDSEAVRDRTPTIEAVDLVVSRLPDYRFLTVSDLLSRGRPIELFATKVSRQSTPTSERRGATGGVNASMT